jgi:hypothetical protein
MNFLTLFATALMLPITALAKSPGETHGTAHVLEEGDWEYGLATGLHRGFGSGLELSIRPLGAILSPHLVAKKVWKEHEAWTLTTRHSLNLPTPLLRTLARPGTGGVLPADAVIPIILVLDSRFLATVALTDQTELTLSTRLVLAASFGQANWSSIDMPMVYSRTAAYHDGLATAFGAQLDGGLIGPLGYRVDLDLWWMPLSAGKWSIEGKACLPFRPTEHFAVQLTGTAVVGQYPYGVNWHLLPGFDLSWSW